MNDAWVYQNGTTVGVDAYVDQRLAKAFKTDSNYTMHLEARAVNDETSGYRVVAKLEKPLNEWLQLFEAAETKTDDSGRVIYILDDLLIPMLEDANLSLSDELYCTLQIGHKDWTNTFGAPSYRWTYSGGDHAYILPDGADMPEPMIWVHNLHPDTFFGERVLDAVAMINEEWDMDITVHYVTPEVMDEQIGALAGWPGYGLSNNGGSDVEIAGRYLIYCNMPSIVRESLGDYISRACRGEVTTAKLTKTGAADTFEHMYGHLDEESELFSAAYRLSLASYNASKDVTRESAGEDHHWTEETWTKFDGLLERSKILVAAPEGEYEASEYRELATEIMEMHMDFNGDILINFDFRFHVEEYDAEHYKVTVYASDVEMADLNIDYYWSYFDNPSQEYQIVKKDELYRVMCTISSKITKPGNFQTLYMSNPENPEYTISQTKNSISVTFAEYDYSRDDMTQSYTLYNIPEVKHFAASLLDSSGAEISQQEMEKAGTMTFTGLQPGTEYILRIHTANEVGRSDILTETVTTNQFTILVDGKEVAVPNGTAFETIDLTDTAIFPNGANDAYQVTINGETRLVGDTTLQNWVGSWESWQDWIYPDQAMQKRYPFLEEVWETAFAAYIKAFEGTFMEETIKAQYKTVDDLKQYWYDMTYTNGVSNLKVEAKAGGHQLTWLGEDGKVLAADSYTMTGKILNGLEGATMYVFTADTLEEGSDYKYLVTMVPDMEGDAEKPIARHYHFQFGGDLDTILATGQLNNGLTYDQNGKKVSDMVDKYWYATMIDSDATDVAKYNVILGMHRAEKWSELPNSNSGSSNGSTVKPPVTQPEPPEVPEEPSVSPTFTDVAADSWYTADVAYVAEQGLMTGTSDTTFSPNSTTTRAMLMTILARLAGEDTSGGVTWYEKGMAWAMENGVSDGTNPTGSITREQLATMLWRYAGSPEAEGSLDSFTDSPQVSDYAVNALIWAVENGIVNGNPDGTLNPQGSATRAQMAAMLHRFCENIL